MRVKSITRTAALGALVSAVAFAGAGPLPAAATTPQEDRALAALAMAVDAVGGAEALRGLRTYRYKARSMRGILDEGVAPGDSPTLSTPVQYRVRHALGTANSPRRLRVDSVRTSLGTPRRVNEVIVGQRGFIRGTDANFSAPGLKAMTSDRMAAIRKEQTLLTPHLMLRRVMGNVRLIRNGGMRTIDGRTYRVLVIRHAVAPVRLFVDTATGRLTRLRTTEHDYLRRDVPIEVVYRRWVPAGGGLMFPRVVSLWSDGERLQREIRRRADIQANPGVRRPVFTFPDGLQAPFRPRLARIGVRTSQWIMAFATIGFIKDGGQTAINPQRVAPGVFLLGGVANNSLVIRRDSGVVIFEGALHDHRAEAVIRFVQRRFPNRRITHVVTTHHHSDHAGGQRPYVAMGARAVLHEAAVPFFRRVFRERDSLILPDRLDGSQRRARIVSVPNDGNVVLPDVTTDVEVYPIATPHAVDMTIPFAVQEGVVFVSDIYTPGGDPGAGGQALQDLIEAQNLNVSWIAGGHGGVISHEDFLADLGQ